MPSDDFAPLRELVADLKEEISLLRSQGREHAIRNDGMTLPMEFFEGMENVVAVARVTHPRSGMPIEFVIRWEGLLIALDVRWGVYLIRRTITPGPRFIEEGR